LIKARGVVSLKERSLLVITLQVGQERALRKCKEALGRWAFAAVRLHLGPALYYVTPPITEAGLDLRSGGMRGVRSMKAVRINDKLWVAPQIDSDDLDDLKAQGITGIINNRPDDEEFGQPPAAEVAEAAKALGLTYGHVPFAGLGFDEALVRQNQAAIAASSGPVVAHCRSGTRSLTIWAIGEVLDGRMTVDEAEELGARFGFDLRGVGRWIAFHRG
jgi:uncharacterized protein (TIGR01244 family)